jgi:hypothetical protein
MEPAETATPPALQNRHQGNRNLRMHLLRLITHDLIKIINVSIPCIMRSGGTSPRAWGKQQHFVPQIMSEYKL